MVAIGWLLWRKAKSVAARRAARLDDRTREWSTAKALDWASAKGRELALTALDLAKSLLPASAPEREPLVGLYMDFLSAAKSAGYARSPGRTPLEFGDQFSQALPGAEASIRHISAEFSKFYYSAENRTKGKWRRRRAALKW